MTISYGSNLGLLENAADGEGHADALRKLLRGLDALIMSSVKTRSLATPPASPANGDRYLVGTSPTGGWSGQAGLIARYSAIVEGWEFYTPKAGWSVWVDDEGALYRFVGTEWRFESGSTLPVEKLKIKQLEESLYTLVAADANTAIHCNQNLADMVIVVPAGVFEVGDQITIVREGDVASVTLNFSDDELMVNGGLDEVVLPEAYSAVTLICKGGKYFTLIGDYE